MSTPELDEAYVAWCKRERDGSLSAWNGFKAGWTAGRRTSSDAALRDAVLLFRELFNNLPESKIEEHRARGEERIPVFISIDYLDRVMRELPVRIVDSALSTSQEQQGEGQKPHSHLD